MYRMIGFILMVAGTFVILMLGVLVLVWCEIVQIPKLMVITDENLNEATPELVPSES